MARLLAVCHDVWARISLWSEGLLLGATPDNTQTGSKILRTWHPLPPARMDQPTLTKETASQPHLLPAKSPEKSRGITHSLPWESPAEPCQDKAHANLQGSQPSQELECHPASRDPSLYPPTSPSAGCVVCGS